MIKNVKKYQNSIALIIVDVENIPEKSDKQMIEDMLHVFRMAQDNFSSDSEEYKFIDIVWKKRGIHYQSVTILRRANQTGSVQDIPWMQTERKKISFHIRDKSNFTMRDNNDFGYKFSNETNDRIPELINEIWNRIQYEIEIVEREITKEFTRQESRLFDLEALNKKMAMGIEVMNEAAKRGVRMVCKYLTRVRVCVNVCAAATSASMNV